MMKYATIFRLCWFFVFCTSLWCGWVSSMLDRRRFNFTIQDLHVLTKNGTLEVKGKGRVMDAWGNDYQSANDGFGNLMFYSTGPDGRPFMKGNVKDDIFLFTGSREWTDEIHHFMLWRHLVLFMLGVMISPYICNERCRVRMNPRLRHEPGTSVTS